MNDKGQNLENYQNSRVGTSPKIRKSRVYTQTLNNSHGITGIGIGLVVARRIVAKHGGRMWADCKPKEGATFLFVLRMKP